jgi:protein MYSM1
MDVHSHLVRNEVIGLLGGRFDAQSGQLNIILALPCNSTSTGIQCEMDPMSEVQARETLASLSMELVGWYHSHPAFEPHPSIRDIENQASYQVFSTFISLT